MATNTNSIFAHDMYSKETNTILPEYIINLDLPPEERWAHIVPKYSDSINSVIETAYVLCDIQNCPEPCHSINFF